MTLTPSSRRSHCPEDSGRDCAGCVYRGLRPLLKNSCCSHSDEVFSMQASCSVEHLADMRAPAGAPEGDHGYKALQHGGCSRCTRLAAVHEERGAHHIRDRRVRHSEFRVQASLI